MEDIERLSEAFKANKITKILLIDDGFDAPDLNDSAAADWVEWLENEKSDVDSIFSEEEAESLLTGLNEGEKDTDNVTGLIKRAYEKFLRDRDNAVDPGNHFSTRKSATLDQLEVIEALAKTIGSKVVIEKNGLDGAFEAYKSFLPDVVFLDYYLSQANGIEEGAQEYSTKVLVDIVKEAKDELPAIILMSSKDKSAEADGFRATVDESTETAILAVRFGFFDKKWVSRTDDKIILFSEGADVLLDISQGFRFGFALQKGLGEWKSSVEDGLSKLMLEVAQMKPKDLAYIQRFRLAQEKEKLSNYLCWILGENLLNEVGSNFQRDTSAYADLDNELVSENLEGAFAQPSDIVARFYHRARVDETAPHLAERYGLGDLFLDDAQKEIRAIISPDCDLVPRTKGKPNVTHVLTVGGKIEPLQKAKTTSESVIFIKKEAFHVEWRKTDIRTYAIEDDPKSLDGGSLTRFGTLRSTYALQRQQNSLQNTGRIGLIVSPAILLHAPVRTFLRGEKDTTIPIDARPKKSASILVPRGANNRAPKILFSRAHARSFVEAISKMDSRLLDVKKEKKAIELIKKPAKRRKFYRAMLRDGLEINTSGALSQFGVRVYTGTEAKNNSDQRVSIHVVVEISQAALREARVESSETD